MSLKERFTVGDVVDVFAEAEYEIDSGLRRTITRHVYNKPRRGTIVSRGTRQMQEGRLRYVPANFYGDGEYCYLEVSSTVPVWLVRFGMLNKPVRVLDGDVISAPTPGFRIPVFKCRQSKLSERDREILREFAKAQPRDEKGRFVK